MSIEDDVAKLKTDMYFGDGKNNPSVVTRLAELEGAMMTVQEGVSNFRDHSKRATKFFDSAEAIWAADTRRRTRNLAISLVVIPCFLGALGWGLVEGGSLVIHILQIEQQWQQSHPSEFVRPQSQNEPQNAKTEKDFAY